MISKTPTLVHQSMTSIPLSFPVKILCSALIFRKQVHFFLHTDSVKLILMPFMYSRTRKAGGETPRKGEDPRRKSKDPAGPDRRTERKGCGENKGEARKGKSEMAAKGKACKEKLTSWRTN